MDYSQQDHLELVQLHYQDRFFENTTFERSDIDNCQLERLSFCNCCFDRSSLTCIQAKGCVFKQCKFRNVDMLSCSFTNCSFQECDFSLANICDNSFYGCMFSEASFTGATLKENEFIRVSFISISLRGSSTCLNAFRHTTVLDSEFGNCTVDSNIAEDCQFQNSSLNVEMLGTFFGIKLDAFQNCKFLSLGEQLIEYDQTVLSDNMRKLFLQQGRYIEAFILDINQSLNHLISGSAQLCTQLKKKLLTGNYIPSEQLQFLFNVFKELYRQKHLGFLALYELRRGIWNILEAISPESKYYEKFILLYNNLTLLHNSMIEDLGNLSDWEYFERDRQITVCFKFEVRPSMPITDILEICYSHVFGHKPETRPIILEERTGSYLAILQTTVYTLLAFRICTYLLVGSVKELIKLRANTSLLLSKKLPKKYYLAATNPETTVTIPQAIAALLSGLLKKVIPTALKDIPVIDVSDDNLKEIREVSDSPLEGQTPDK